MALRIGIAGTGAFAQAFIPLFKAHPLVDQVVLCDLDAEKLSRAAARFGIDDTRPSLDALCGADVDAVCLFTQNWLHGPQAVQALEAGKHVYSAVPPGISVDEIERLVAAAERTGRVYMLGETSYYYPGVLYCREQYDRGAFGRIVYGHAEYYHDWGPRPLRRSALARGRELAGDGGHPAHVLPDAFDEPDHLRDRRPHDPRVMPRIS